MLIKATSLDLFANHYRIQISRVFSFDDFNMAEVTVLSLTEVANHSQGDDLWVCIRGYG